MGDAIQKKKALEEDQPSSETSAPSSEMQIYRYHSYRSFLKDWIGHLKKSRRGYSLSSIARKTGLSLGFLSLVLNGKRVMTQDVFDKITPHLHLGTAELSYFKLLWKMEDSDSQEERLEALKKAHRFQNYRKLNANEVEAYQLLTKWYMPAIREMAALSDFRPDPKWIQKRLRIKVPLTEIKNALQFLIQNQYIDLSKSGNDLRSKEMIYCHGKVYKMVLSQFHSQMLGHINDSIHDLETEQRKLTSHMMAIPRSQFERVKEIVETAKKEIAELGVSNTKSKSRIPQNEDDMIYYVNFGAIPLTNPNDEQTTEQPGLTLSEDKKSKTKRGQE